MVEFLLLLLRFILFVGGYCLKLGASIINLRTSSFLLGRLFSKWVSFETEHCSVFAKIALESVWDYKSSIEITKDWNGIDQVSLYGGQVTSWRNDRGEELLFTSSKYNTSNAFILLIFMPTIVLFGNCGLLEQHGFARNKIWTIDDNPPPLHLNETHGKSFIDLLLKPSEEDLFEFRLRVSIVSDGNLVLISRIRNINGKPFSFSFAYHTYLSVSAISEVRIEGLETLDYLDNLRQRNRFTEQGDSITFESELDQVYLSSPNCIAVLDHERKQTFVVRKEGLPDIVVWNPWEKKSKSMVDLGDEEYKQMLCVDGAAIEKPITLKPGEEWTGRLELAVVPLSFCSEDLDPHMRFF
ncbi:unnamed protein product [Ilex paraguariensis]|uniref:glucose-6-phosphate 1-epimerase n=1 Tax=Ilex paraguariensis TaxID=185542 RepID=A0ABC8T8T1_9AQUA